LHLEFTLIFATNFVDSLDIKASREVFPIEVRSPEIEDSGTIAIQFFPQNVVDPPLEGIKIIYGSL